MPLTQQVNHVFRQKLAEELHHLRCKNASRIAEKAHIRFFGLEPEEDAEPHKVLLREIAQSYAIDFYEGNCQTITL